MKNKKLIIPILLILVIVVKSVFADLSAVAEDSSVIVLSQGENKASLILKYENNLLSADIKSATIKDIFEKLKKQTGMAYEIEKEILEQKVTISLKDKELTQAIKEILNTIGNPSYMLSYRKNKAEKYEVARVRIEKTGKRDLSAEALAKAELQEGEMEVGLVEGNYYLKVRNMRINELLDRLSTLGEAYENIVADNIDKIIDFEETAINYGRISILLDHIFLKIRPKIYNITDILPERDRKGKIIKLGYIRVTRMTDTEIQKRLEQAQLKNSEGERLMKQGRYLEALDAFGWAGDPDYTRTQLNLGKIYLLNREYLRAIGHFNTALDIDSTNIEAWLGLSEAYEKEEQMDKALESMEKYVEFSKDNTKKEELDKKIKYLTEQSTKDYYAYLKNGDELRKKKDIEKAKEEYKKAIGVKPELPSAHKKLGQLYEENKDYKNAEDMYKKVIEKDSKNFQAYTELAGMYAETGRTQDAIGMLMKAASICPVKDTVMKINLMIEGLKQEIKK